MTVVEVHPAGKITGLAIRRKSVDTVDENGGGTGKGYPLRLLGRAQQSESHWRFWSAKLREYLHDSISGVTPVRAVLNVKNLYFHGHHSPRGEPRLRGP